MNWTTVEPGIIALDEDGNSYRIAERKVGVSTTRQRIDWVVFEKHYGRWSEILPAHPSLDAAKQAVGTTVQHRRELKSLGRQEGTGTGGGAPASSPWGKVQDHSVYADGVVCVGTARHGGIWLSVARAAAMPETLRDGRWYEEDSQWALVALAFPELFTSYERDQAEKTVRNGMPDRWEKYFGRRLAAGESRQRDQELFSERHREAWVVIAASMTGDDHPGMVSAIATIGGVRQSFHGPEVEKKTFLVEKQEYAARGSFGFVIDLERHQELGVEAEVPRP